MTGNADFFGEPLKPKKVKLLDPMSLVAPSISASVQKRRRIGKAIRDIDSAKTMTLQWGKSRTKYLPKREKLFTDGAIFSQFMQMKNGYICAKHLFCRANIPCATRHETLPELYTQFHGHHRTLEIPKPLARNAKYPGSPEFGNGQDGTEL